jgi:predicted metal-dependent hydrolase
VDEKQIRVIFFRYFDSIKHNKQGECIMAFKKAPAEKPNKIKIELALERSKESVQNLLNQYENTIQGYLNKMVNLKKEGRMTEAARYKDRLKLVLSRRAKMEDIMDQIEQFGYMIDEAFAKNEVYSTLGMVLGEANKMTVSPELKTIFKQMNEFQDIFTKGLGKMDSIFGKMSSTIMKVDESTASVQDAELDAIVNSQIETYDQQTTVQAEASEFDMNIFS